MKTGERERPGVVVFGLDNVLYPHGSYVRSAFRAVSQYVRVAYGWEIMEDLLREPEPADMLGAVLDVLSRRATDVNELLASRLDAVMVTHMPDIALSPDARVCLATLPRMGVRTALLPAGDPAIQRLKVQALGVAGLVDHVIYPDDLMGSDRTMEALQLLSMVMDRPLTSMVFVDDERSAELDRVRAQGMVCLGVARGDAGALRVGRREEGRVLGVASLAAVPDLLADGSLWTPNEPVIPPGRS